jgi:asparagine synthase (glutamine-hydrolysing)
MCGICGIVAWRSEALVDSAILKSMCRLLRHRGPDDEGYYADTVAQLAMRRLSILDLATGHQPIANEARTVWLVYNGEIYNYRELRRRLEQRGHIFASQSDSEVIVHAYEEYGDDCLAHFNGMFAIALWDALNRRLLLARDRIGIKPLYYWSGANQLVFGSELKAVMAYPGIAASLDAAALDQFLTLEYIPAPLTIFAGVRKLPAGHKLVFSPSGLAVTTYWDVSFAPASGDQAVSAEALGALIQEAVQLQLISDVPLGALLSGGIDSSTVVAQMSALSAQPVQTFSIGFDDASYNELPYARVMAAHVGAKHTEQILQPDIAQLAHELVPHFDEPFADFSIFPTYLVSKLARPAVKVVLSGDGGDEVFGGYDTYVADRLERYYRRLPAGLRQQGLPGLLSRLPPQPHKKGVINRAKRFVEGAALPPELQHTRWMMFMSEAERHALYRPEWRAAVPRHTTAELLGAHFQKVAHCDPLAQQQYVDIKTYLADGILTKVDRMSMAASLEVRVPLLDHRIVELGLNLPARLKLAGGRTKQILRRAMRGQLPAGILNRPKQGFSIPLKHWLHGPLRPLMLDLLSAQTIRQRGYFNPETVAAWLSEHLGGYANHSHRLWALMVFELWHQRVFDRPQ